MPAQRQGPADGFFRREFARPAAAPQEIEQSRLRIGERSPGFRPARMDERSAANEFSRQAQRARRDLAPARGLRREAKKACGGNSCGKDGLARRRQFADGSRAGQALAERRLPGTVVNALAEALQDSLSGQARKGLRDRRDRNAREVFKAPEPFAGVFDAAANPLRGLPRARRFGALSQWLHRARHQARCQVL